MGNIVTPELLQLLQLLSPILVCVFGAWAYTSKRDSDARLKDIESDADTRKATAQQISQLLAMHDKQIMINQQGAAADLEVRKSSEEGYRVIRGVQNDTNIQLTNLTNVIKELKNEIVKIGDDRHKSVMAEIGSVKQHVAEILGGSMKEFAQTFGSEIGMVMARQMAIQSLDRELMPFPAFDDPSWKTQFVKPRKAEAWLYKQPYLYDNARLQNPCALINPDGETLRVIAGRLQDWLIIMKPGTGDPCYGYLPAFAVEVLEVVAVKEMPSA